jgi:hypothetical protein
MPGAHPLAKADVALDAVAAAMRSAPPEPRRIAKRSSSTGKRVSNISGSVRRLLVMCVWTALAPSKSGPRPRRLRSSHNIGTAHCRR